MSSQGNADQFKQSFQEEGREILVDLEAALLELNADREDQELVGRVFRALHTIKGSGSMFGFEALAAFTHNLENAYDEVRNGRLEVSSELIDLTLASLDQIRAMLEERAGGADAAVCEDLLSRVRALAGRGAQGEGKTAGAAAQTGAAASAPGSGPGSGLGPHPGRTAERMTQWAIRFAPGPEQLLNGSNPLLLLAELRELGGLAVKASMEMLPPLRELDPERCYVTWEMVLATNAGRDAVRDVFIFVEDSCELSIEPMPELGAGPGAGLAAAPDTQPHTQPHTQLGTQPATEAGTEAGASAAAAAAAGTDPRAPALHTLPVPAGHTAKEPRAPAGGRRTYDKPDMATSLRVPAVKLDQFVDLVGELVTVQARLAELAARRDDPEVAQVSEEIERLTSALRENSMNIRMLPIRATFEKFRRLVHDLARDLGKDVELTVDGADTELDKTVIDQLSDPLMHLIRNSMDHGIEPRARRVASGKPGTAKIHLSARHSGASVLIAVSDDGGGINAEAVRQRAVEKGLVAPEAPLSESEIYALIFEPGFSTAPAVTDVSGRGVGMDVVRQRVESLRGSIDVTSKPQVGTSITLRLPLTLAIIDGLLVAVDQACFVLPLATTLECIELSSKDIAQSHGKHVAHVRGEIVPYIRLREHFGIAPGRPELEQIMVVETGEGRFGFVVDKVLGDCQTVIKSLGRVYRHVQAISGATILGDGRVALIIDPERLVQDAIKAAQPGGQSGSQVGPRAHPDSGAALRSRETRARAGAAA